MISDRERVAEFVDRKVAAIPAQASFIPGLRKLIEDAVTESAPADGIRQAVCGLRNVLAADSHALLAREIEAILQDPAAALTPPPAQAERNSRRR